MLAQSFNLAKYKGVLYGAIAGSIATWSISTAIAASEVELGLPISTFYSIMGLSLGYGDFVGAAYFGFALHILTGTLLGAITGLVSVRWVKIMTNTVKAIVAGVAAGIAVWAVLFLPVTVLLVLPSLDRIAVLLPQSLQETILSGRAGEFVTGIAVSAVVFHVLWGAIFGYIASTLMKISAFRSKSPGSAR
ncbi:MAG: hypothetical protein ACREAZ_03075 [Nitrososphaera sp.]